MSNYYSDRLNASNLQKCYEIAPQRIQQYLEAEINFVLNYINPNDSVLELGCGYGRVTHRLIKKNNQVIGIDISEENIKLANELFSGNESLRFYIMDAKNLSFENESFDITICIQNGISAFKIDPLSLFKEAIRVTKKGGTILFSSYAEGIWEERLNWFKRQADLNLIGDIDTELTHKGTIVCKDGFTATTYSAEEFKKLASSFNVETKIIEVDNSSIFCTMKKK